MDSPSDERPADHDTPTTPGSDRETDAAQREPHDSAALDQDVDADAVAVLPGTGGPDDVGDVEVDPADLNMPGQER